MRSSKYYKFMDGLCLREEEEFLGKNKKPYMILEALSKSNILSDEYMSKKLGMNKRTYQRHKSYLIMVGALQVRQLNATTYVYILGEKAIDIDDKIHRDIDYKKAVSTTVANYSLIDDDKKYKNTTSNNIKISKEDADILRRIYCEHPMPTTEDIIDCM